jgi:hypothetical protein
MKKFRKKDETILPREELFARFEIREKFLSDIELSCYRLLCETLGDRGIVCPKPRVLESLRVLNAPKYLDDAMRIERKHVDFLVCDYESGHPLCAVQIDWWNEELGCYRSREHLLEQAFSRAGLPVAYIRSNQIPCVAELRQQIGDWIEMASESNASKTDHAHDSLSTHNQSSDSDLQRD